MWAYFGYTAPVGTTDEARLRPLTLRLPAAWAERLFTAQDKGESEEKLREIMAEAFQEIYFKDGGRAAGLEVKLTGIQAIDISY